MTKQNLSKCTNPDCPHEKYKKFNNWTRNNLPDSKTGFLVSDLDLILYNYITRKFILLEIKTFNKIQPTWQKLMFKFIDECFKKEANNFEYLGLHLIKFEKTIFDDGLVTLDGQAISEQELKKFLSF